LDKNFISQKEWKPFEQAFDIKLADSAKQYLKTNNKNHETAKKIIKKIDVYNKKNMINNEKSKYVLINKQFNNND